MDRDDCINAELIRQHADILSKPEWRDLGYEYLNIDDCWPNMERNAQGLLEGNSSRFPNGIKVRCHTIHISIR